MEELTEEEAETKIYERMRKYVEQHIKKPLEESKGSEEQKEIQNATRR